MTQRSNLRRIFAGLTGCALLITSTVTAGAAATKTKTSVGGVSVSAPRAIALNDVKWSPVGDGVELGPVEGNPQTGAHASWVRLAPGAKLPNHHYSNAIRGVVLSGKLTGTIRSGTQDIATPSATPGTMFVFPAKLIHSTACESTDPCVFQISQDGPFVVTFEKATK
jgi:quercetin dioxygenase-like cupin family protein